MKRCRYLFLIIWWIFAGIVSHSQSDRELVGQSGEALLRAAAAKCIPSKHVNEHGGEWGAWALMEQTDATAPGASLFINRFGTAELPFATEADNHIPLSAILTPIVPGSWFAFPSEMYSNSTTDLYNLWPSEQTMNVGGIKEDFPPGIVLTPEYNNGVWAMGLGNLGGQKRRMWQPAPGCFGEAARVVMYMLAQGYGSLIGWECDATRGYADNVYPILSKSAATMLMEWHRQEPPTEREKQRNNVFEAHQGNRNPFVDYPLLAEYLWGEYKGEPYEAQTPLNPDNPLETDSAPLRARYRLSDTRINLVSRYVPENALWEVDGRSVTGDYLIPSELGEGLHELRFYSGDIQGKVKIRITR